MSSGERMRFNRLSRVNTGLGPNQAQVLNQSGSRILRPIRAFPSTTNHIGIPLAPPQYVAIVLLQVFKYVAPKSAFLKTLWTNQR
ncbi:hypothetical protein chiPu_0011691 [Chiloscyllium punctatum]|uniref:Uncharacterized protein n=1 Tax=Chiloscyllium punctatum TaxID=137246 RepID=A0A401SS91_CHIPU|nr:hypothetical protein [Chiloscyllium punctatum]